MLKPLNGWPTPAGGSTSNNAGSKAGFSIIFPNSANRSRPNSPLGNIPAAGGLMPAIGTRCGHRRENGSHSDPSTGCGRGIRPMTFTAWNHPPQLKRYGIWGAAASWCASQLGMAWNGSNVHGGLSSLMRGRHPFKISWVATWFWSKTIEIAVGLATCNFEIKQNEGSGVLYQDSLLK